MYNQMTATTCILSICALIFLSQNFEETRAAEVPVIATTLFNVSLNVLAAAANNFSSVDIPANEVTYFCYNKSGDGTYITVTNDQDLSNFMDLKLPIKIIFHGWTDNGALPWIKNMAKQYYKNSVKINVIAVNWSKASGENYIVAARAVQSVGRISAEFFARNFAQNVSLFKQLHILGHSLGAHVGGFFGKSVQQLTGVKVGRITGMDAANPLFETPPVPSTLRMASTDADFTDFLHTNKGVEGVAKPYGLVDCYINKGGPIQPGCDFNVSNAASIISCSHQSVHEYYCGTINNPGYLIGSSSSLNLLDRNSNEKTIQCGEYVSLDARGIYEATNTDSFPYP